MQQIYYKVTNLPEDKSTKSLLSGGFVTPGEVINAAIQCDEPINFITILYMAPGSVKGNHFHKKKIEHITVLRGEVQVRLKDLGSGQEKVIPLQIGQTITIFPNVAHALQAIDDVQFLEVSPQSFDPADIFPEVLIPQQR